MATGKGKTTRRRSRTNSGSGGGVVIGIFIGLMLGALLAIAAAWYITRHTPFVAPENPPRDTAAAPKNLPGKPGDKPVVKQDFTFYKDLPKGQEANTPSATPTPVPDVALVVPNPPMATSSEHLYLQVGAFENPVEADNMKALLALNGIDALAQRAQLDDGRVMHRVRIGPFAKPADMTAIRSRLASVGLEASVVRASP